MRFPFKTDGLAVPVTISNKTFFRLATLTVATILILMVVKRAEPAIVIIFVAFFFTLALNAPVHWMSSKIPGKRKGSRALATTISFLLVIALIALFLANIGPPLAKQTDNLIKAAPRLVRDLHDQNSSIGQFIRHNHLQGEVNNISSQLSDRLKHAGGTALSTIASIGNSLFFVVTVLVLTFMMLVEGPRWVSFFHRVMPARHHELTDRLAGEMYGVIKGYVNGQVLLALIAAAFITPAVLLLHVSYGAAMIVVIFIGGLIPMVGHPISAVIVASVALVHSVTAAIIILIYYLIYMQIENYVIQPRIQATATNMSPLLVLMSLIVGVSFGGLIGGLIAIPAAGCLRIALLEYLRSLGVIHSTDRASVEAETK
jgi:predicted PurR-regulated permease PerM